MYEHTWAGLIQCYAMAIPFFRYTLCGDLFFAVTLFGSYAVASQFRLASQDRSVPAAE
jgi:hypothetical protein